MNVFLTLQSLQANYLQVLNGGKLQSIWKGEISPPLCLCNAVGAVKKKENQTQESGTGEHLIKKNRHSVQRPDWLKALEGSFGRVNYFLRFPALPLISQVTWRSAGAAVDKTPNRCLIDTDHTDWQSSFCPMWKERLTERPFWKVNAKEEEGEEVEIQIKSKLSQRDRFTVPLYGTLNLGEWQGIHQWQKKKIQVASKQMVPESIANQ